MLHESYIGNRPARFSAPLRKNAMPFIYGLFLSPARGNGMMLKKPPNGLHITVFASGQWLMAQIKPWFSERRAEKRQKKKINNALNKHRATKQESAEIKPRIKKKPCRRQSFSVHADRAPGRSAAYQNGISSSKSIGGSLEGAGACCCGRDCAPPLNCAPPPCCCGC